MRVPNFILDLYNRRMVHKYRQARAGEFGPRLERRHGELLHWFDSLPARALDHAGTVPRMGGRLTVAGFLPRNSEHSRRHAAEIRAALGR